MEPNHAGTSSSQDDIGKKPTRCPGSVARELDVYVQSSSSAAGEQLCVLQQPLRPSWRPYELETAANVRFKPVARRLEMRLPLDTACANYDGSVEASRRVTANTLRSSLVDTKVPYALGTVRDGKLVLTPVNITLALRPSLEYLNTTEKSSGQKVMAEKGSLHSFSSKEYSDMEEDEITGQRELTAVQVQVKRRETEKQQQARLNSYAYMAQKEEEEPWVPLHMHSANSSHADAVSSALFTPQDSEDENQPVVATMPVPQTDYLRAVVASDIGVKHTDHLDAATPSQHQEALETRSMDASGSGNVTTTEQLHALVDDLFERHSVCSLKDVRKWLLDFTSGVEGQRAANWTDSVLHKALTFGGEIICIRGLYLKYETGNTQVDLFRKLIIDLLQDKETFRKNEVLELAQRAQIIVPENVYSRVVKGLCVSRGPVWMMKSSLNLD